MRVPADSYSCRINWLFEIRSSPVCACTHISVWLHQTRAITARTRERTGQSASHPTLNTHSRRGHSGRPAPASTSQLPLDTSHTTLMSFRRPMLSPSVSRLSISCSPPIP
eukprot:1057228-Pleurochrysis_carterae.AAC.1